MQIPFVGGTRNHLFMILSVSILYGLFWILAISSSRELSQFDAIEGVQGDFFSRSNQENPFHYLRSVESNASQLRKVSFAHANSSKVKLHERKVASPVSTTQSPEHESEREPFRKWAYAFLIGGCSNKNHEYRGFLYNVIAATQQLRMSGSKADVVVFLQMSVGSNETSLPEEEEKLLTAMNIKVHSPGVLCLGYGEIPDLGPDQLQPCSVP
jgi:hypothetical protein